LSNFEKNKNNFHNKLIPKSQKNSGIYEFLQLDYRMLSSSIQNSKLVLVSVFQERFSKSPCPVKLKSSPFDEFRRGDFFKFLL